jgi:thiamine biosynthesis lipoprotein
MGTYAQIQVTAENRMRGVLASEVALVALEQAEGRLSTWSVDSDLNTVNLLKVGEFRRLPVRMVAELNKSAHCYDVTKGYFNPWMGNLVHLWGLRQGGRRDWPKVGEVTKAMKHSSSKSFEISSRGVARLLPDVRWEEGGFAKGAALDAALEAVRENEPVGRLVLNLGGQILVSPGPDISIVIRDSGFGLKVSHGSVSTSGNEHRSIYVKKRRFGHILDPHTGVPAKDHGATVVWAPTGLIADCLSTGLYAMGLRRSMLWSIDNPDIHVASLTGTRLIASCNLRGKIVGASADRRVQFVCDKRDLKKITKL